MLPFFFTEWHLDSVDAGWISGIYYGAYMVSVIILVSITDWIDAKKIYIGGALITCLSCVGFAFFAEGYWTAMLFRTIGGIGLAGTVVRRVLDAVVVAVDAAQENSYPSG